MSDRVVESKPEYWRKHYERQHNQLDTVGLARSLEYANERVQMQIYAHVLEGVGTAFGKSILDVGCGWGNISLMLHACGGRVTGVDIVPQTIAALRDKYPFIAWDIVDLADEKAMGALPAFDCVVAAEVLEHVDFAPAMASLWQHVAPGGRLVAAVPNSECPILQRGRERWGNQEFLVHISPAELSQVASTLPEVDDVRIKGFSFQKDQRFLPYAESGWDAAVTGVPNRIIFCLMRAA